FVVFTASVLLLVGFGLYEAFIAATPMMPMRIFENGSRLGTYLVMLVVGAAMFGMFYFITFFIQGVRDYSALKTGFAFLPIAFVIGITSQIVAKLLPRFGPKPLIVIGTGILTVALLWLSTVDAHSSYLGKLLPGMLVLAFAMGFLFVPLTTVAVSKVADTDAGLASALLNVGQQVGGAIGLSVLATVFATSAKSYASDHSGNLQQAIGKLPAALRAPLGGFVKNSGGNGLQSSDIKKFVSGLPASERGPASGFFNGPYKDFAHDLQAHASGQGFFAGAMFAVAAILIAVFVIKIKREEVPTEPPAEAAVPI
ncbi:MAG: MFS transporter, partial [Pseudonocardiales bacterium]